MPRTTPLLALVALLFVAGCEANFHCRLRKQGEHNDIIHHQSHKVDGVNTVNVPQSLCYIPACEKAIQGHIKYELDAAFKYLAMGAHFAQESVNRRGIAKFLLGAASEERSHAILMLDYLNKRGIQLQGSNNEYNYNLLTKPEVFKNKLLGTFDYKEALTEALKMELEVTQKIYNVIEKCADDFHGADVFTNPILDEQHEGVRHLQGAIKVFNNLMEGAENNAAFKRYAEYTFDMQLLKGEIAAH